ncbi:hypothetical protein [Rhodovulum sulfidophilum]|uniref:hypothetical protein n=1 Tax=Rhodovulum sulfidophilum TaxID=35806 RepID=UPI000952EC68|nr:hypothetical protein [Rhodovulum sulfidophilum]OLS52132.1 hypothetical protein BV392_09080 [Rhodovulum sulfidophilum]
MSRLARLARAARGQHGKAPPGRPKPGGPVPPLVTGPGIAEAWDMQTLTPGVPARPGGDGGAVSGAGRDAVEVVAPKAEPETPPAPPERAMPPEQVPPEPTATAPAPKSEAPPADETSRGIWRADLPGSEEAPLQAGPLGPVRAAARHLAPPTPPPQPEARRPLDDRPTVPQAAQGEAVPGLPSDDSRPPGEIPPGLREAPETGRAAAPDPPAPRGFEPPPLVMDPEPATAPRPAAPQLTIGSLDLRITPPPEPTPPEPRPPHPPRHGAGLSASSVLRRSGLRRL